MNTLPWGTRITQKENTGAINEQARIFLENHTNNLFGKTGNIPFNEDKYLWSKFNYIPNQYEPALSDKKNVIHRIGDVSENRNVRTIEDILGTWEDIFNNSLMDNILPTMPVPLPRSEDHRQPKDSSLKDCVVPVYLSCIPKISYGPMS
ncbi:unnamed protein product [Pieris macdunnoughi]|uniref:Uncharacterized protein n=1 Tax=Pieris macdunnoughi TaxID=345717 RepID=A0A821X7J4_9NEOP|nr:unnamed protein product [Pieris macdunnoughi]